MKYLLFISVLFTMFSCSKSLQQRAEINFQGDNECFQKAAPVFKTSVYQTGIDVVDKHISGILLVKAMPDSSSRVVFTNEAGITFFDFEWNKEGVFRFLYCIPKLNKKVVINMLRKDFELILIPRRNAVKEEFNSFTIQRGKEVLKFKTSENCESITLVEVMGKKSKLVDVVFTPAGKNVPDSVYLNHYNFKMNIVLKRIEL